MAIDLTDLVQLRAYDATHKWMYKRFGKASRCEQCKRPSLRYQWSNISRDYKRERSDWQELCQSCHRRYDVTPEFLEKCRQRMLARETPLHNKAIWMCSRTGELLRDFVSATEAEKQTGISRSAICNNLKSKSKSAGGYVWQYQDKGI